MNLWDREERFGLRAMQNRRQVLQCGKHRQSIGTWPCPRAAPRHPFSPHSSWRQPGGGPRPRGRAGAPVRCPRSVLQTMDNNDRHQVGSCKIALSPQLYPDTDDPPKKPPKRQLIATHTETMDPHSCARHRQSPCATLPDVSPPSNKTAVPAASTGTTKKKNIQNPNRRSASATQHIDISPHPVRRLAAPSRPCLLAIKYTAVSPTANRHHPITSSS